MMSKVITLEEERRTIDVLGYQVQADNWVNNDTVFVNCDPTYSSIGTQLLTHKLKTNNLSDFLELEIPEPDMSQVFNKRTLQYEFFDKYLVNWVARHIHNNIDYLFIDSGLHGTKHFKKIKTLIQDKCKGYRFLAIYAPDTALVDYRGQVCNGDFKYEWQF